MSPGLMSTDLMRDVGVCVGVGVFIILFLSVVICYFFERIELISCSMAFMMMCKSVNIVPFVSFCSDTLYKLVCFCFSGTHTF